MRILVVDDDVTLCKNIANMLTLDYYAVDTAHNGIDALDLLQYYAYDLLVLDWMLPGISGVHICEQARARQFDGGILMLTAKDANEDIIEGLDAGADDYLVKPFEMAVLRARVRALLRRKNKIMEEQVSIGALTLNKGKRTVAIDNVEVHLTKNEFLLLEYLIENRGIILSHEQIIEYVWDVDDEATTNTLAALVRLVRKKIDIDDEPSYIQSVRGEQSLPEFAKQRSESIVKQLAGEIEGISSASAGFGGGMPNFEGMAEMNGEMPNFEDMPEMNGEMPNFEGMPEMNGEMPNFEGMPQMNGDMPNVFGNRGQNETANSAMVPVFIGSFIVLLLAFLAVYVLSERKYKRKRIR